MNNPFIEGESYYLLYCGPPCEMVYLEETETDYLFTDNGTLWGGSKEEILDMYYNKVLTQDKEAIAMQIDYIKGKL